MLIIELSAFHRSGTIKNMIIIIYMDVKDIEDAKYVEQNFYMELWKIIKYKIQRLRRFTNHITLIDN